MSIARSPHCYLGWVLLLAWGLLGAGDAAAQSIHLQLGHGDWNPPGIVTARVDGTNQPQAFQVELNGDPTTRQRPDAQGFVRFNWPSFAPQLPYHTILVELQTPNGVPIARDLEVVHDLSGWHGAGPQPASQPVAFGFEAHVTAGLRGYQEVFGFDEIEALAADVIGKEFSELTDLPITPPAGQGPIATVFHTLGIACVPTPVVAPFLGAIVGVAPFFCLHGVTADAQAIRLGGDPFFELHGRDPNPALLENDGAVEATLLFDSIEIDLDVAVEASFQPTALLAPLPRFDLHCPGTARGTDRARFDTEVRLDPDATHPSRVDVTQGATGVELAQQPSFWDIELGGVCAPVSAAASFLGMDLVRLDSANEDFAEALEQPAPGDDDPPIASALETVLDEVSVTGVLADALQSVTGLAFGAFAPIREIHTAHDGVRAAFDPHVFALAVHPQVRQQDYFHAPHRRPEYPSWLTPTKREEYEMAATVATGTLNQALRTAWELGAFDFTLSSTDALRIQGLAPGPITASMLSFYFVVDFGELPANQPVELRFRATLPPVVTMPDIAPGSPLPRSPVEVHMADYHLEFVPQGATTPVLRVAVGATAGLDLQPGNYAGELRAGIGFNLPTTYPSFAALEHGFRRWPSDDDMRCLTQLTLDAFVLPEIQKQIGAVRLPSLRLTEPVDAEYQPVLIETLYDVDTITFFMDLDPVPHVVFAFQPLEQQRPLPTMCPGAKKTTP